MKTKSTLFKCLAALFIALNIVSCQSKNSSYAVTLDDSVKQAVIRYVNENDIDLKSRIITTHWVANPYRTDIYISNSFRQLNASQSHIPTYYTTISDSIIVFIYSGVERNIGRDTEKLSNELKDLLTRKNIKLKPDNGLLTHTRTWLYAMCGGSNKLIKEPSVSDLFYIPCRDVASNN